MTNPPPRYAGPPAGHPPQTQVMTDRAVFTEAYAVIPKGVMRDIVTSNLPHWHGTRAWVLARPLTGFAETFAQMIVEIAPGGGSDHPEPDTSAQAVLFVTDGNITIRLDGGTHDLGPGGYAYLPPASGWTIHNDGDAPATLHWVRKRYVAVDGIDQPPAFFTSDAAIAPTAMPGTDGRWATTRFVDPSDLRHDMHVNIVTFEPGACIQK